MTFTPLAGGAAAVALRDSAHSCSRWGPRELAELRRAVGELGMIGRNRNQIARVVNQSGKLTGPRPPVCGRSFDIASYGRRGPGHRWTLTSVEIAHASRTARAVPEVLIKVSGGARTVRGVATHLAYLEQRVDLETDEGAVLHEKGLGRELLEDWDLELDEQRRHTQRAIAAGRKPPKLVHNLVFSMPKGTPPEKLLKAVKKFATEKFGAQHRYAMALHTDQGHPHVHVVVKARSERGERLNIYKATLREWRRDFAQYLRDYGVEANATERAVRGSYHQNRKPGIFRAAARGDSSFMRERAMEVARELRGGGVRPEAGHSRLVQTRREVERGWRALAEQMDREGQAEVAAQVRRFVDRMPPVRTDGQWMAERMLAAAARERAPEFSVRYRAD
jgi:type IV secretory pathway VirD2 relaxase